MTKNLIDEYIELNTKEINSYMRSILNRDYDTDISKKFTEIYINVRFYNFYENEEEISFRKRLIKKLKEEEKNLIEKYEDKKTTIENVGLFYCYLIHFDTLTYCKDLKSTISKLNRLRFKTLNKYSENFDDEFYNIYLKFSEKKKQLLEKYETNEFKLKVTNYSIPNTYRVNIDYNIKMPNIYSEFAIRKAFNTGVTHEDKLFVEYNMISKTVIYDIIKGNFKKLYILEFPETILKKKQKMKSLLNIIDNTAIKDKVSMKLQYEEFQKNKEEIYGLMRDGFRFSVILDDSFVPEYLEIQKLKVFEFVIINKNLRRYDEIMESKVIMENVIEV